MLRPYQISAIDGVRSAMRDHKSCVLVCPTGGGKTVIGAEIVRAHLARSDRHAVLWLAHRAELVDQAARTIGGDVRRIIAGRSSGSGRVTVASIDTIRNWGDLPGATLVVVDECHHARAATWEALLARYSDAYRLGLTATPQRHDGRGLGDVFASLVVACTVRDLTRDGYLVPCRVFAPPEALDGLAMTPVDAWERFGKAQKCVVFATTVEQAAQHAAEFDARRVRSAVVTGATPDDERREILAQFARGEIGALCNVAVLTEGWDCPSASVAILARGCSHAGLYLQIVGRVLRPAPDKFEAIVIDLKGVSFKHGLPDADRTYTLDDDTLAVSDDTLAAIAQCKACGAVYEWQSQCPRCGHYSPPKKRTVRLTPAELRERFAGDSDAVKAQYRARLEATAREKGYKKGWIEHMWRAKYG